MNEEEYQPNLKKSSFFHTVCLLYNFKTNHKRTYCKHFLEAAVDMHFNMGMSK